MERELKFMPHHFVVSKTPINTDSKNWIYKNLHGRFCLVESIGDREDDSIIDFWITSFPAFEDPQEAILYELTWG